MTREYAIVTHHMEMQQQTCAIDIYRGSSAAHYSPPLEETLLRATEIRVGGFQLRGDHANRLPRVLDWIPLFRPLAL